MIKLIDAAGRARDDAKIQVTDKTILIGLPEGLPQGTQVDQLSRDLGRRPPGRGIDGVFHRCCDGNGSGADKCRSVAGLTWLARIGVYLGLFVGVGGAFFAAWIAPARAGSKVVVAALAIGVFSAVAALGLQGLDL